MSVFIMVRLIKIKKIKKSINYSIQYNITAGTEFICFLYNVDCTFVSSLPFQFVFKRPFNNTIFSHFPMWKPNEFYYFWLLWSIILEFLIEIYSKPICKYFPLNIFSRVSIFLKRIYDKRTHNIVIRTLRRFIRWF